MDSFTQIVLGAACGEAVAGRKIGNRALLWGAVGGTIPDLDVLANFFTDELTATAFHRGFMHSFLFAALAPWVLAWAVPKFYDAGIHRRQGYKTFFALTWLLLYLGAAVGINVIPKVLNGHFSALTLVLTGAVGLWFGRLLWVDYWRRDLTPRVEAPYRTWVSLFFWSIFTHPILDCFTNWGTQIWQPFADTRVQWCTVSVVDPIATVPFALCLLVLAFLAKNNPRRTWLNWVGIGWFCAYLMVYTLWHKGTVNHAFENTLQAQHLDYQRIYTNPTIFNNIVWSCLAESDSVYYFGLYGFNDATPGFKKMATLPKNHQLLNALPDDDRAKKFLLWFTEGYYNVQPWHGDTLQVNDLRFGLLGDTLRGNNYVFPFLVFKRPDGSWDIHQNNRSNANLEDNKRSMGELWNRIQGLDD